MSRLIRKLRCRIFGHEYRVVQVFTGQTRRVLCFCCGGDWAMNDNVRVLTPWSSEFHDFYTERGIKIAAPQPQEQS